MSLLEEPEVETREAKSNRKNPTVNVHALVLTSGMYILKPKFKPVALQTVKMFPLVPTELQRILFCLAWVTLFLAQLLLHFQDLPPHLPFHQKHTHHFCGNLPILSGTYFVI